MMELGLAYSAVISLYEAVLNPLDDDRHYWLQRAQYEAAMASSGGGDLTRSEHLELAREHVAAAQDCFGGNSDTYVQTAWASIIPRLAAIKLADSSWVGKAVDAIDVLRSIVKIAGRNSPHTFVVIARDGTNWLEATTGVTDERRRELARQLKKDVALGQLVCAEDTEVLTHCGTASPRLEKLTRQASGFII